MLLQSPLSADPDLHAGIVSRLDDLVDLAREELGDALQSVLLGGSLARGEAFGVRDRGELRLLSDLDLYFVSDADGSSLLRRVHEYAEGDEFLVVRPDAAVVPPTFFIDAPDAMPTHQLAHAHVILFGAPVTIASAEDTRGNAVVDPDDAAALLFNRFVESLDPALGDDLPALMHRTKVFIDAPMAWLGSVGAYTPDRHAQIERFRAIGLQWHSTCAEHFDGALNHWVACLKARERGVVDREELEGLASASGTTWYDWTGGFAMALLTGGGIATIHDVMRDGLDLEALRFASMQWLKRKGWVTRLRRARQWQGIAPESVTSWRRHGPGGTGPDRIFAAACLRYHGVADWTGPLEDLTRQPLADGAALHALWWRWIQGREDG
jgi:hypothetical protein